MWLTAPIQGYGGEAINVIIGIVLMIAWSFWVGLIAFGGFARGKWY